ncbi:hypothetical protein [Ureibacillus manganicus]|uniref:Uncharacterized protein n=1 Tax=Ureibacillus manganicus DSM 26584 TaxID=1384049 RepID=A0A0A3IX14_9BACL|nr:hypothetical protein [Ureibacillus manganicus]KGR79352.1 hypothetical protein CD29_06555 [Ureibacillus manganicus DSM 26584]
MNTQKFVMKSIEQLQLKHVRHFYRSIAEINGELAKIHKSIESKIDKQRYRLVTEYINQFISYTSVWNVKFVYNLESPEVAMLQIFHLEYIFGHEQNELFRCEIASLEQLKEKFLQLNAFKIEHIKQRKQKMLHYITSHKN